MQKNTGHSILRINIVSYRVDDPGENPKQPENSRQNRVSNPAQGHADQVRRVILKGVLVYPLGSIKPLTAWHHNWGLNPHLGPQVADPEWEHQDHDVGDEDVQHHISEFFAQKAKSPPSVIRGESVHVVVGLMSVSGFFDDGAQVFCSIELGNWKRNAQVIEWPEWWIATKAFFLPITKRGLKYKGLPWLSHDCTKNRNKKKIFCLIRHLDSHYLAVGIKNKKTLSRYLWANNYWSNFSALQYNLTVNLRSKLPSYAVDTQLKPAILCQPRTTEPLSSVVSGPAKVAALIGCLY